MPLNYARYLVGRQRTLKANRELGFALAFVAGAINAGGFLAVHQYTSHVTGMVSSVADNLALGHFDLVLDALAGVAAFLFGSVVCTVMVMFARHRRLASEYALPLLLEASLILCFGLMGPALTSWHAPLVSLTMLLLCFIMGLQNAVMTKLSHAVIRTTHMTGIVTDLGIGLGKLLYRDHKSESGEPERANTERIAVLSGLLGSFVFGGVGGAFGFKYLGYVSTVPVAVLLAAIAVVPVMDDLRHRPPTSEP